MKCPRRRTARPGKRARRSIGPSKPSGLKWWGGHCGNEGDENMSPGKPVVETRELTKRYGTLLALDRLTMAVEGGQILGFIGPNGAGKTTTIKILVGLARPTAGSAMIAW